MDVDAELTQPSPEQDLRQQLESTQSELEKTKDQVDTLRSWGLALGTWFVLDQLEDDDND